MRRRSAVLEALERLRRANPDFTVAQIIAFLTVADEDGPLPLPDLRRRADMTPDAAWKTVQALAASDRDTAPLLTVDRWAMRAIVAAELTPAGVELARELDAAIGDAQLIDAGSAELPAR